MTHSLMHPSLFDTDYKALVIGASGAIGGAFLAAFEADPRCTLVTQLSRSQTPGFDVLDESSIQHRLMSVEHLALIKSSLTPPAR